MFLNEFFRGRPNKTFYVFVNRRKYKNTILQRSFFKKFGRLLGFNKLRILGRKTQLTYKLRFSQTVKAYSLLKVFKKIYLSLKLLINKQIYCWGLFR